MGLDFELPASDSDSTFVVSGDEDVSSYNVATSMAMAIPLEMACTPVECGSELVDDNDSVLDHDSSVGFLEFYTLMERKNWELSEDSDTEVECNSDTIKATCICHFILLDFSAVL